MNIKIGDIEKFVDMKDFYVKDVTLSFKDTKKNNRSMKDLDVGGKVYRTHDDAPVLSFAKTAGKWSIEITSYNESLAKDMVSARTGVLRDMVTDYAVVSEVIRMAFAANFKKNAGMQKSRGVKMYLSPGGLLTDAFDSTSRGEADDIREGLLRVIEKKDSVCLQSMFGSLKGVKAHPIHRAFSGNHQLVAIKKAVDDFNNNAYSRGDSDIVDPSCDLIALHMFYGKKNVEEVFGATTCEYAALAYEDHISRMNTQYSKEPVMATLGYSIMDNNGSQRTSKQGSLDFGDKIPDLMSERIGFRDVGNIVYAIHDNVPKSAKVIMYGKAIEMREDLVFILFDGVDKALKYKREDVFKDRLELSNWFSKKAKDVE